MEGVKAGERDGFQLWVNLKILQALHEKLVQLDLIGHGRDKDPYFRVFGIDSVNSTTQALQDKIHLLQKLARSANRENVLTELGNEFLDRVLDTNFLIEMVRGVIEQFKLTRLVFLFDEAAHTFIPAQQEIFFEIFKLLHGGHLAVKAAVYPTVTSYGRNFESGQDAIVISMDRFEPGEAGRSGNRKLFRDLLDRGYRRRVRCVRASSGRVNCLIFVLTFSTGNPRAFLHLLNRAMMRVSQTEQSR